MLKSSIAERFQQITACPYLITVYCMVTADGDEYKRDKFIALPDFPCRINTR